MPRSPRRFVDHDDWTELRFRPIEVARVSDGRRPRWSASATRRSPATPDGRCSTSRARRRPMRSRTRACGARDVDGIGSFMVMHDSVKCQAVATTLAVPGLRWSRRPRPGRAGTLPPRGPGGLGDRARGRPTSVVLYRAMNGRSGPRVGTMAFDGPAASWRYPIGYDAYLMYVAMWAQRFLAETGQGERGPRRGGRRPARVRRRQRARRAPPCRSTSDEYLGARRSWWTRSAPTTARSRSTARARSCVTTRRPGAGPRATRRCWSPSAVYRAGPRSGLDIGDHLLWDDYTRNYTSLLRDELFGRAGAGAGRRRPGRDLRLLHEHGAHGARGAGLLRAGRLGRVRAQRCDPARRRAPGEHARRAAWRRATCTG